MAEGLVQVSLSLAAHPAGLLSSTRPRRKRFSDYRELNTHKRGSEIPRPPCPASLSSSPAPSAPLWRVRGKGRTRDWPGSGDRCLPLGPLQLGTRLLATPKTLKSFPPRQRIGTCQDPGCIRTRSVPELAPHALVPGSRPGRSRPPRRPPVWGRGLDTELPSPCLHAGLGSGGTQLERERGPPSEDVRGSETRSSLALAL